MRTKRWPIAEKAACRRVAALKAMVASRVFAVFAVLVVVSAGASVAAGHASAPTVEEIKRAIRINSHLFWRSLGLLSFNECGRSPVRPHSSGQT